MDGVLQLVIKKRHKLLPILANLCAVAFYNPKNIFLHYVSPFVINALKLNFLACRNFRVTTVVRGTCSAIFGLVKVHTGAITTICQPQWVRTADGCSTLVIFLKRREEIKNISLFYYQNSK